MVLVAVGSIPSLRPDAFTFFSFIILNALTYLGGEVAQLVRALACRASGRGFESRFPRSLNIKLKVYIYSF